MASDAARRAPNAICPTLVDYWLADGGCFTNTNGTSVVTANNGAVGSVKTAMKAAVIAKLNANATFKTAVCGARSALQWGSGEFNAFGGNWSASLAGCSVVLLIKYTATGNGQGIFGLTDNTATQPYDATSGFYVSAGSGVDTIVVKRDDTVTGRGNATSPCNQAWQIIEIRFDQSVDNNVTLPGYSGYPGTMSIRVNGGGPGGFDDSGYTDQTTLAPTYMSLGGRFSAYSAQAMQLAGFFIFNGPVPQKTLQKLYEEFVLPYYGSGVFPAFQAQTKFKERGRFSGVGIHSDFCKIPLDDWTALGGAKWVRISAENEPYTDAKLDAIIDYYHGNGWDINWQLTVEPVTTGVFYVPSDTAIQICQRYAAKGYVTPSFGLGNEAIQQNTTSGFSGVEADCRSAFITCVESFRTALAGYDYHLVILNDEGPYALKVMQDMVTAGVELPDACGWHQYEIDTAAELNATADWLEKTFGVDMIGTEGNMTSVTVTRANAIAWAAEMLANATATTVYYRASAGSDDNYSLYDTITYDGIGVGTASGRTATITGIASALGVTLP